MNAQANSNLVNINHGYALRQLRFLTPLSLTDIPARKQYRSEVLRLPFWSELEAIVEETAVTGIAPFEAAAEVNFDEWQGKLGGLKKPMLAVLVHLRKLIKTKECKGLDVLVRGNRLILVGRPVVGRE